MILPVMTGPVINVRDHGAELVIFHLLSDIQDHPRVTRLVI